MKKKIYCPNPRCSFFAESNPAKFRIVKYGSYRRKCDGRRVVRFRCQACLKTCSNQSFNPTYHQHKPRINKKVFKLLVHKVSMRGVARVLGIDRKTVTRKFVWLGERSLRQHVRFIKRTRGLTEIQADEMETFEHTKCKPLSIALVVSAKTRHILAAEVSVMPAKGKIAAASRKKYGRRRDDRKQMFQHALEVVKPCCDANLLVTTDMKPAYRNWIDGVLPNATHEATKGRRGCVVGYGELKRGGFDPLFSLNHTAGMIRDNLARMLRKTWCTTKKMESLRTALIMYIVEHNTSRVAEVA